jgi:hypothetical protein
MPRPILLFAAATLFAQAVNLSGTWVWERTFGGGAVDPVTHASSGPFVRRAYFEFKGHTGIYRDASGGAHPIDALEVKGNKITFFTGRKGGDGENLHTRWEGVVGDKEIKGDYFFDDGIRGVFLLKRSEPH